MTRTAPPRRDQAMPSVTAQQRHDAALRLIRTGLRLTTDEDPIEGPPHICRDHIIGRASLQHSLRRAQSHGHTTTADYLDSLDQLDAEIAICLSCQRYATGHRRMAHDIADALGLLPDVPPRNPSGAWRDSHSPAYTGKPRPDQIPTERTPQP